ncbi:FecR family protein [uncultured Sanguibacteroides sp.]|uniref:FecR family protein n=1 Tax=uncultured Sanguibacteroides sp. TaxID=1635151 RepID=UPI0025DB93E2|nr:FecR family protein [uncultured Sanguibacteroides sp.]
MNYNDQDIEFAYRILNHRKELREEEVINWLKNPEHTKLLDEIAAIRQSLSSQNVEKIKEEVYSHLRQSIQKQKNRYLTIRWSVAASVLLVIGLFASQIINHLKEKESVAARTSIAAITPGEVKAQLILSDGKVAKLKSTNQRVDAPLVQGIKNDSLLGLSYRQVQINDMNLIETEIQNTLVVPTGGFYPLELSDGTRVWLNSESELRFPVKFLSDKREVTLKGEAYFTVKKDSTKPFIVHVKDASVEVLGTTFNINTYGDDENIYTTLVNGSVKFISEKNKQEVILKPGMQSVMNTRTGNTGVRQVNVQDYISWKEGRFVFHSMTLESIMQQLRRWYDIEIFYQNPEIKQYEFRGVINRDMDLNKVLNIISETTNITFNINNRTITISKR